MSTMRGDEGELRRRLDALQRRLAQLEAQLEALDASFVRHQGQNEDDLRRAEQAVDRVGQRPHPPPGRPLEEPVMVPLTAARLKERGESPLRLRAGGRAHRAPGVAGRAGAGGPPHGLARPGPGARAPHEAHGAHGGRAGRGVTAPSRRAAAG